MNIELRWLIRSNSIGEPERVLQWIHPHWDGYHWIPSTEWEDIPTVYTEEIYNDQFYSI